ncbi:protein sex-lethal-like isoform X2 [Cucurbita maxima]|uniref:Protein sex-lethal-like isoform X2 n=1 Tax=Cucurbita maxima TaxID=3661 RepID=A0A6J1J988_CUCMA|nr:protein sex-lethal-like isoform X2 [Cucurbita maxima]
MSEGFGNGGLRPNCGNQNANLGRKRPRIHSDRTVPADHAEASGLVRLYVAQVPRTGTEEAIRPLFEVHGDIVKIVILRDKTTGQQKGSCFVKYATSVEADRAISALDNQYTFPGELTPMNVKYADSERDRLEATTFQAVRDSVILHCLGLPRNASQATSHAPLAPNAIQKPQPPQIQEPHHLLLKFHLNQCKKHRKFVSLQCRLIFLRCRIRSVVNSPGKIHICSRIYRFMRIRYEAS